MPHGRRLSRGRLNYQNSQRNLLFLNSRDRALKLSYSLSSQIVLQIISSRKNKKVSNFIFIDKNAAFLDSGGNHYLIVLWRRCVKSFLIRVEIKKFGGRNAVHRTRSMTFYAIHIQKHRLKRSFLNIGKHLL